MEYYEQYLHQPDRSLGMTGPHHLTHNTLADKNIHDSLTKVDLYSNWVTLLNYFLAVFLIIHNSIIVRFYYLHRTDITQLLFLLIGLADIFAAIAMIILMVSATLYNKDLVGPLPYQRGIILVLLIFPVATACSRSFNVIMSLIKTINIASIAWRGTPVQIHNTAVIAFSFFMFLLWLSLNTSDLILIWLHDIVRFHTNWKLLDKEMLRFLFLSAEPGQETSIKLAEIFLGQTRQELNDHHVSNSIVWAFVVIHLLLPSFITLICMLIQACSIKITLAPSEESPSSLPSASYVNTTIFMITALFCFCHSAWCIWIHTIMWTTHLPVESLLEFSLPLINSALFPVIIILRKQSLRERYRDFFVRVLPTIRSGVGVVVRKCGGVVRWVGGIGRRADYEELSGVEES